MSDASPNEDRDGSSPTVLILENHGLVLGSDSCKSVEALLALVEEKLATPERSSEPLDRGGLRNALGRLDGWRLPKHPVIHQIQIGKLKC